LEAKGSHGFAADRDEKHRDDDTNEEGRLGVPVKVWVVELFRYGFGTVIFPDPHTAVTRSSFGIGFILTGPESIKFLHFNDCHLRCHMRKWEN